MIAGNWRQWVTGDAWRDADLSVLAPPPRNFDEILRLAHETDIDPRRLVTLVASDPVIAIRVLRLANSAAYAPMGGVTSIERAVIRLGTQTVREAVLAAVFSAWAKTADRFGARGIEEVQHAVGTACLARLVAERAGGSRSESFLHGLLHDIGKLFLLKLRTEFIRLGGHRPATEETEAVIDEHHAEMGATALQLWGLPETVREPVRWHHAPLSAPAHQQSAAIVYTANRLSHRYGFGRKPGEGDGDLAADLAGDPICAASGVDAAWLAAMDQDALNLLVAARQFAA